MIYFKYLARLLSEFDSIKDDFANALSQLGFQALEFSVADARNLSSVVPNKDPFNRMIASQAIRRNFTLITADRDLRAYRQLSSAW